MSTDVRPIAYLVNYDGPEAYQKSFEGSGYGVVFEDDGETGYLYATNEDFTEILDALHLFDRKAVAESVPGDETFIVWNPRILKAGFFFGDRFQAVVDFKNQLACCRDGSPPPSAWCKGSHEWNPALTRGLE